MALAPECWGLVVIFGPLCAVLGRFFNKSPDSSVRSFARHSRDIAFGAAMMVSCTDRPDNAT